MTFAVTLEGPCYTYCARVFFAGGQGLTISGLICHNHKHYDPETMRSARPRVVVHTLPELVYDWRTHRRRRRRPVLA